MSYNELIKNFAHIRGYIREFYVYGIKSRDEYIAKSARTYDNERRRLEGWMSAYIRYRRAAGSKHPFLVIDSRTPHHNPLFAAWKSKSFTDGDITLHFILLDILHDPSVVLSLGEILAQIDDYLHDFDEPMTFDESTVRKKLKEYVGEGVLIAEKHTRTVRYRRASGTSLTQATDMLDYFTEIAPVGVIGSYLLDKLPPRPMHFRFKHHYITHVLDSDILCTLFAAMQEKRAVEIVRNNRSGGTERLTVIPLRVMISAQNGRQHLAAFDVRYRRFFACRIDSIVCAKTLDVELHYDELRRRFSQNRRHMWGVNYTKSGRTEHVEFTVHVDNGEEYIVRRLEREKRCGTVERLDAHTYRFSADVYDTSEMIPWIRTFICRIKQLNFSNRTLENQFKADIRAMYRLYALDEKGGDTA